MRAARARVLQVYPMIVIKVTHMAIILIAPVATQTKNGYPAEVTGIDLTGPHCLRGTINAYGAVKIAMRWTLGGLGRGTGEGSNLNITTPEMAGVVEAAKRLGAGLTATHSSSAPIQRLRAVAG
jgi:hypothetical protein